MKHSVMKPSEFKALLRKFKRYAKRESEIRFVSANIRPKRKPLKTVKT